VSHRGLHRQQPELGSIFIGLEVSILTIRYDSVYLTCSKKLTDSQHDEHDKTGPNVTRAVHSPVYSWYSDIFEKHGCTNCLVAIC